VNSTKVFILSINKESLYKTEAEKAGADGYICKDDFVDEIEHLLKGSL
jgi:DNA-binding NarL/FixJ family response regulator